MATPNPQYIVDRNGKPVAVIVSIQEYERLLNICPQPEGGSRTREQLVADLRESLQYVKKAEAGKHKARKLEDLLDEL